MPLPRFQKLPREKQDEILDAAAAEFGSLGYAGASIAAIVERAGVSKSAVYYYFQDKADLYQTVLLRSAATVDEHLGDFPWAELEGDDFWDGISGHMKRIRTHFLSRPTDLALWREGMLDATDDGPGKLVREIRRAFHNRWRRVFTIGRERGEVRVDLPLDTLIQLFEAADAVIDRHTFEQHADLSEMTEETLDAHLALMMDTLRRLLVPWRDR